MNELKAESTSIRDRLAEELKQPERAEVKPEALEQQSQKELARQIKRAKTAEAKVKALK